MPIDLVLINPMAAHGIKGGHAVYGDLGETLVAVEQPLWCRLIASYIRNRGYSVKIIDAEALKLSPDNVAIEIAMSRPRLVAIAVFGHQPSASTQQMTGAGETARQIKKRWPESQIMMLGGHVSALPERTMREEAIDFACVGEGPVTIDGVLKAMVAMEGRRWNINPPDAVPGLVWWRREPPVVGNRQIIINPRAPLLDVNGMDGMAWDLLPMHLYRSHNWQVFGNLSARQPYASIYTSLGCPFSCSFCCINSPFDSHRYRMRSPADVVDEIRFLRESYGVKTFKIIDEMFVLNERHYMAIANGLAAINHNDELNIWAYARVDTVKPHTLTALRHAGIRWLALGIESGSKYVMDGVDKRLKTDEIEQVVRTIQAHGINVIGNYIFGLPDDSIETMQQTLDLALRLNTEFANFYSAQAYPGSPLYDEAVKNNWTLPETWRGYSQHNDDCRPLDTKYVLGAEVLKFRDDAFEIYFRNPAYLDMVEKKFGTETLEHVKQMTRYKLKRKLVDAMFAPSEKVSSQ